MGPILKVANLSKKYDNAKVLDSVGFEIGSGKVISIIGPSGAGKTTLLKCLSALTPIDSGQIVLNGESAITPQSNDAELAKFRKSVGFVFQDLHLWPHKTVLENLYFAPNEVKKMPKEAAIVNAIGLLGRFGLKHKAESYPDSLSGGQKQRVAIARALAMEPKVVLMDEITSALDPELVGTVAKIVRELAKDGMAVLIVTHNMDFAADVSDEIVFLENGRVVEHGTPHQIFINPESERTLQFVKSSLMQKMSKE